MISFDDIFDYFFYVIEIIIITIIISIVHLHKLFVIRNDRRPRALFSVILLEYLYIFFSLKTWKICLNLL